MRDENHIQHNARLVALQIDSLRRGFDRLLPDLVRLERIIGDVIQLSGIVDEIAEEIDGERE